ncbi:MAG: methane monooxygenase/ammonia monooxygenase subunit A [Cycloclasticus sp.]|nr:methane monooxygenase/ammonia monooxygenase subunit A [Cycloclasticus sp.]MBQ0789310.1 methane monooxygenase/ammonia monooxygenase subunit A [Cycloclasticus sp.]
MKLTTNEATLLSAVTTPNSEAARIARGLDMFVVAILFFAIIAAFHIHIMLTVGDWDFWVDWKDRMYWVTATPMLLIFIPAALSYPFMMRFGLPIAGTLCAFCLVLGEWISRIVGFHLWTYFPYSMIWPAIVLPGLMLMDLVLLLSRNLFITSIFGGSAVAFAFAPANWPILAPYHEPVVHMGQLVNVADMIGYSFTRTATPEYLRFIERGTLRTFGGESTLISTGFSGFVCMILFFVWWKIGEWLTNLGTIPNVMKKHVGLGDDDDEK